MALKHIPVLLDEVMAALDPRPGGVYLDATVGDGGHATAILEASAPDGRLIGLDADPKQVALTRGRLKRFGPRLVLRRSEFAQLDRVSDALGVTSYDGILFDLGFSSRQLVSEARGLSFAGSGPLDMRLTGTGETAAAWLNRASAVEIADALFCWGDRRDSRRLAREIVRFRQRFRLETADDLKTALGLTRPHDLAPIWQAIRVVVNDEIGQLTAALPKALDRVKIGSAVAVITFHSGEDRVVKQLFRARKDVTARLVRPSWSEIKQNRRARSAKLRVARRHSPSRKEV